MRCFAPLVVVLIVAGCGSSVRTVKHVEHSSAACNGITADLRIHYSICGGHRFIRNGRELPIAAPPGAKIGHWAKAFLSPDGRTLLAQWSGECEIPAAFFVSARGGRLRVVTGDRRWQDAPESIADGWTNDGRAIVEFPFAACGSGIRQPGIYLVALDGTRTLVQRLPRRVGP